MLIKIIAFSTLALTTLYSPSVQAADYVQGYFKKNGTYVAPHYRSKSDGAKYNNYSTKGNSNPYTGQKGYKNPYSNPYSLPKTPKNYLGGK